MLKWHYTVDGIPEPICDCDDCDNCDCDDCEYSAVSRGLSHMAIGGVFADVATNLFPDGMPGVEFEQEFAFDYNNSDVE